MMIQNKENDMITISFQTVVILILVAFIFGMLVGGSFGRSRMM